MKTRDDFNGLSEWTKYLGSYGEARFAEECAKRNIKYVRVEGESYDGLIEINGKFHKVQIKAVSPDRNPSKKECIYLKKQEAYTHNAFDYLALYVSQYDKFYLIPVDSDLLKEYSSRKISFFDEDYRNTPVSRGNLVNITLFKHW